MTGNRNVIILSFIILNSLITASFGFTVTYSNNGGASTATYILDDQTSLNDNGVLDHDLNFRTIQISGSGNNEYNLKANAEDATVQSGVASSGQVSASASSVASDGNAALCQNVGGTGSTTAYAQGTSGQASTGQSSEATDGSLDSSMTAYSGNGASQSSQNSRISADSGSLESNSEATDNGMFVSGSVEGGNDMTADLTATAGQRAQISGTTSAAGNTGIDDDTLNYIANNDGLGFGVDGITLGSNNGLGGYSLQAANVQNSGVTKAAVTTYGFIGCLANYRTSPNIQMQLLTSTIPANLLTKDTGKTPKGTAVATAIATAANTWDQATWENLFMGDDKTNTPGANNAVVLSSDRSISYTTPLNGRWTEGWTDRLSKNTIAETDYWYSYIWDRNNKKWVPVTVNTYSAGAKNIIIESDCWYNSKLSWTFASVPSDLKTNIFDVQTIATHELGHTLGLDDLYASSNYGQIMYGYNNGQVKWTLQQGDSDGLHALYGPQNKPI